MIPTKAPLLSKTKAKLPVDKRRDNGGIVAGNVTMVAFGLRVRGLFLVRAFDDILVVIFRILFQFGFCQQRSAFVHVALGVVTILEKQSTV